MPLRGHNSIVKKMLDKDLPLTREVYMAIAGMPLEMGPELEQLLPRPFRLPNPDA